MSHPDRTSDGVLGGKTPDELSTDETSRPVGDLPALAGRTVAGTDRRRHAAGSARRCDLRGFVKLGLDRDGPRGGASAVLRDGHAAACRQHATPGTAADHWLRHREELRKLINRTKDPLKPKSAYLVVKAKYGLGGSYETFTRVARAEGLNRPERRRMIRSNVGERVLDLDAAADA